MRYLHRRFELSLTHNPLVQVIRITLALENGISAVQRLDSSVLKLGDGRVKDAKFADGYTMLVLWESNGELFMLFPGVKSRESNVISESTSLLAIPYGVKLGQNAPSNTIPYTLYAQDQSPKPTVFGNEELLEQFSGCTIDSEGSFVPESIEVQWQGGRKLNGRSKRIVILGKDRMQYKLFKLAVSPAAMQKATDEDVSMT